jgi:hypothetical protein
LEYSRSSHTTSRAPPKRRRRRDRISCTWRQRCNRHKLAMTQWLSHSQDLEKVYHHSVIGTKEPWQKYNKYVFYPQIMMARRNQPEQRGFLFGLVVSLPLTRATRSSSILGHTRRIIHKTKEKAYHHFCKHKFAMTQ